MKGQAPSSAQRVVAEHVYLESDDSDDTEVPEVGKARKIQASARLRSRVRGATLALDVFDYRYLAVHGKRPWSDPVQFVLDLRFIDPEPARTRRIPRRWLQATGGLIVLCGLGAWFLAASPGPWWQNAWLAVFALLFSGTLCVALLSAYFTTETYVLSSRHGRAKLLEFTGGLGTFRALRAFEIKLAAHIRHALAAGGHAKPQHLRSEMREHQRLKDLAVISEQDYDESKARILRAHG